MDYINSYIDEWKRLRADEETFKEFIKNLTPESFMEFIMKINKELKELDAIMYEDVDEEADPLDILTSNQEEKEGL